MKMAQKTLLFVIALFVIANGDDDLKDFDFANKDSDPEIMIAQESRLYQTIVKPPVKIYKPTGVTNSHRPQYNIDSEEDFTNQAIEDLDDFFEATTRNYIEKNYKNSFKLRAKQGMIRDAVIKALERKDHVGKFAQILPIIRSMSGSQRTALASLVASQVSTPPGKSPLNLSQVRSMFGDSPNTTSHLMLPILLDMANLIRRAVRSGKEPREVKEPQYIPKAQMLRRSLTVDDYELDDDSFESGHDDTTTSTTTTTTQSRFRGRSRGRPQRIQNRTEVKTAIDNTTKDTDNTVNEIVDIDSDKNTTKALLSSTSNTTTETFKAATSTKPSSANASSSSDNGTLDLAADATNQTLTQDLPVAEKWRALNRFVDRKGNIIRRGFPKPSPVLRRTTAEPTISSLPPQLSQAPLSARRRPPLTSAPARKLPVAQSEGKCELFTNSLCLHSEDYPTDAIVTSIRRNKAAAGALLADFRDPGEGAVDGVSADQEAKYTADHYLVSNRRGDTANRDFAGAGEAGFMCPSTVKYARPQRARATSGQWKYIVNTGEHTQTLRLEKCLKPKESCTYLTDNFKSKCVQVYNYHRLLTWDQQNGLHMDIFKVPTCCSCHIEGYSVSFPPLGHRAQETSSEHFPGEDLSSEHGNNAFESIQSSIQRPTLSKSPPPFALKPLETFPSIGENHNLISSAGFPSSKLHQSDDYNSRDIPSSAVDSYGQSYFPDSFNQASSIKNVRRPPSARKPIISEDSVTLPSYLEPPSPAGTSSFSFIKETPSKYKITTSNQFKRGAPRPSHRPLRKKTSGAPDDLISSGSSAIEVSNGNQPIETLEDFNDDLEEVEVPSNVQKRVTIAPKLQAITTESVHSASTFKPVEQSKVVHRDVGLNGKRVNYNYHPIIDFFGEEDKEMEEEPIDREDSVASFVPAIASDWTPINHPVSRNTPNNLLGRKKHK